jgi:phosphoserine phosphatase
LEAVYDQRLRLNPGVETLITRCHAEGLKVLLVSGGFTFFAERLRQRLQIDWVRSNALEIQDGRLTGDLIQQSWGDICDGAMKRQTLLDLCSLMGISADQSIAVGDGANDLPMMGAAGLSVAYHAKPKVREQAQVAINQGGLDRLLEVLR